jgi:hypothetical protein
MSGIRRGARARLRACLALVVAAAPLTGTGVATAAPPAPTITPVLECVVVHDAGSFTAVIGYSNDSGQTRTVPYGAQNKLTPTRFDGSQPTTFAPGRQRGVFSVLVDHPSVKWMLEDATLWLDADGPRCPPPTEMPAEGNGTGIAVGLGVAGLVGVALVRRVQRRATPAAPGGPEAGDA